MFTNYDSFDEKMKMDFAPVMANIINDNDKGKYAIVEAREDDTTRLFLKRLCPATDVINKKGWWDIFTISNKPFRKGYWLVVIEKAKVDMNGYLNVCVSPFHYIGELEDLHEYSSVWEFFHKTRTFSSLISTRGIGSFNLEELENPLIEKAIISHEWRREELPMITFKAWLDGRITIEEIERAIDVPMPEPKYDAEIAAEEILKDENKELYPYLANKIDKKNMKQEKIVAHLYNTTDSFRNLVEKGVVDNIYEKDSVIAYLKRAESVDKYYALKKELDKAARKAARKNK